MDAADNEEDRGGGREGSSKRIDGNALDAAAREEWKRRREGKQGLLPKEGERKCAQMGRGATHQVEGRAGRGEKKVTAREA